MYIYACTYIYICIHVYVCVYSYRYVHTCICVYEAKAKGTTLAELTEKNNLKKAAKELCRRSKLLQELSILQKSILQSI